MDSQVTSTTNDEVLIVKFWDMISSNTQMPFESLELLSRFKFEEKTRVVTRHFDVGLKIHEARVLVLRVSDNVN